MSTSSSVIQQRQVFLRQLTKSCSENLPELKAYLSSYSDLICPLYKKFRDPLAMKELSSKCPSCSFPYSSNSFTYHKKLRVNQHLHRVLSKRRKCKQIPTPNTYKRRLFDNFTNKSRSKLIVKCFQCNETRTFHGATRKDIPNESIQYEKPIIKKTPSTTNKAKLKQTFEKVSCNFLKKQSNLRAFLEQL